VSDEGAEGRCFECGMVPPHWRGGDYCRQCGERRGNLHDFFAIVDVDKLRDWCAAAARTLGKNPEPGEKTRAEEETERILKLIASERQPW
jgi:hypothetical protein